MTPREVAAAYFEAWKTGDADRFRGLLAADVTWEGPTWRAENAEDCMTAFRAASSLVTGLDIRHTRVNGADVCTWFDVRLGSSALRPVANWVKIRQGRVVQVRATADLAA